MQAANPLKTTSIRRLGPLDLGRVREEILAIPQAEWDSENAGKPNRNYGALDEAQHIVFRFISNVNDWRQHYDRPMWEKWRDRLEPLMRRAVEPYGYANGTFSRVLLAKMPPGGRIHPHIDANPAARWPHKIHIPIQTNDQVSFYIGETPYHLEVGQAYEVNNLGMHAVANLGDTQRIHLIFEYYDDVR